MSAVFGVVLCCAMRTSTQTFGKDTTKNGKRKAESEKLFIFFRFSLVVQNAKPTLRSESRGQTCLRYAEPQGGKACEAGLMQNAKFVQKLQKKRPQSEVAIAFYSNR